MFQIRTNRDSLLRPTGVVGYFSKGHYFIPIRRFGPTDKRGTGIHFLVWPKRPTNLIFFHHLHKLTDPRLCVFTKLSQPNGNVMAIAEIKIRLDYCFRWFGPIFVKCINQVRGERSAKYVEVRVPLRAAKNDDMVLVYGTDPSGNPLIKWLKLRIVFLQFREMRNWLVEQIVSDYGGIASVMAGDPFPYLYRQLLICFRLVKPRITPAVINVRTGLSAGRAMQIKDYVKLVLCSPANDLIEQSESLFLVREEELVVQGNANGVDSGPGNETHVVFRDVPFPVLPPKPFRFRGAD